MIKAFVLILILWPESGPPIIDHVYVTDKDTCELAGLKVKTKWEGKNLYNVADYVCTEGYAPHVKSN